MVSQSISVVIPNYNGEHLFPAILPELYTALTKANVRYEIIVSDDCSTDQSLVFLSTHYPEIKILQNSTNSGFSITANKGFYAARYDRVFLLNSDVKLTEDYFIPLFKYFDEDKNTFGVMGRITGWNDEIIQDGAKYPSFHGAKIKTTGNYIALLPDPKDRLYSMYLSGANALIDRNKLLQLGGFNELFSPFYVEDYELSLRAWRLGYTCYYDHFAVCRHQVSTSIKAKNKKKYINTIYYRNKLFLHYIHLSGIGLLLWKLQLIGETIFSFCSGKFYFITSLRLFFENLKGAKLAKEKIKALAIDTQKLYSVKQVAQIVLDSINPQKIQRF
ncbi:MAG: glycosyltransferase family 2 protein [Ferruginibacter sp.]